MYVLHGTTTLEATRVIGSIDLMEGRFRMENSTIKGVVSAFPCDLAVISSTLNDAGTPLDVCKGSHLTLIGTTIWPGRTAVALTDRSKMTATGCFVGDPPTLLNDSHVASDSSCSVTIQSS